MNAGELKGLLAQKAAEIAQHLLPKGKKVGSEWKAGNTLGEEGTSLSVRLTGEKAGVWKDFASGESGDLIDLWMASRGLSLVEAIKDIKRHLGIRDEPIKPPTKTYRKPERPKCQAPKARVYEWLKARGLTDETLKAFKVGEQLRDGKAYCVFPFLDEAGELVNVKRRNIDDKKEQTQEGGAAPCLFGWHLIDPNARQIVICEGEIDAMSLHQCGIAALSANQGAGAHQWIETDWDRLERFDDILVCYDNDGPGDKGANEVIQRLGIERCRRMRVGAKDANDWLQQGAEAVDFLHVMADARPLDPDELRSANDFTQAVEDLFHPPAGAPALPALYIDQRLDWFQFRDGEYTAWTGWNGHGKSLVIDQILLGLVKQGQKVAVFSGELPPAIHLQRVHRQASGLAKPARAYIRAIGAWLHHRFWLFDVVGTAKLDRLLEVFTYAARRHGVKHFVIDSLMMIDVPIDGPGALSAQRKAVQRITAFAKQFRVHVHLVAHPRKGDESKRSVKAEVAGSGDIVNAADNIFSVWRRKKEPAPLDPNDPECVEEWEKERDKPDAEVVLFKQRYGGYQDYTLRLWFDPECMQYRTSLRKYALSFVPFSTEEEIPHEPDHAE
ncbi:toprim domain-containing protein [Xenophilus sp. Marseille-Q4582]|uniref:toprim domain-containing protein n=1 Tax=Xenophilus sp. Marseille-Q4582 TaxID=2866600 RepID=UPI001CE40366|nr:toprim domain-containing protein [Xenophilus sp. Marseille-Q4582]